MNLSMSLLDVAILKSIGPDIQKLENTLRTFGTRYRYLIAGYPPFIKDFVDTTSLALSSYELHLVVGGEGISEGLRDHFLKVFRTVHSSYGASDLEINIAAETEFSIALRRLALTTPHLCREFFGRDDPPMVFQYNPLDYLIERSADGELVFSILRRGNVAPKVRYNIHDQGGTIPHRQLAGILARHGCTLRQLPTPHSSFPILFVYGRSDLTVPFYGAKIFTTDVDAVLNGDPSLRSTFHSFQMSSGHDANLDEVLTIILELAAHNQSSFDDAQLRTLFYNGIKQVNQDFREVSKMFTSERLDVQQCPHGTGPFAQRDIRVKNQYIRRP
jgi:phenylacetate-CoA ligase